MGLMIYNVIPGKFFDVDPWGRQLTYHTHEIVETVEIEKTDETYEMWEPYAEKYISMPIHRGPQNRVFQNRGDGVFHEITYGRVGFISRLHNGVRDGVPVLK